MKARISRFFVFLLVVAYALQARAFIFGPSDYEECANAAAKSAKTRDALIVLLNSCETEFPARKDEYGRYVYYDRDTNTKFLVSSPKLSEADRRRIQNEKTKIRQKQLIEAEQRSKKNMVALQLVKITSWRNDCASQYSCYKKLLTANVKNNYHTAINGVSVGWVIAKKIKECGPVETKETRDVLIQPGQTAVLTFETYDGPTDSFMSCMSVTAVNVR